MDVAREIADRRPNRSQMSARSLLKPVALSDLFVGMVGSPFVLPGIRPGSVDIAMQSARIGLARAL